MIPTITLEMLHVEQNNLRCSLLLLLLDCSVCNGTAKTHVVRTPFIEDPIDRTIAVTTYYFPAMELAHPLPFLGELNTPSLPLFCRHILALSSIAIKRIFRLSAESARLDTVPYEYLLSTMGLSNHAYQS